MNDIFYFFFFFFFFFKQKTAYEIKECDWSSDVCSSDLDMTEELRTWESHQAVRTAGQRAPFDGAVFDDERKSNRHHRKIRDRKSVV